MSICNINITVFFTIVIRMSVGLFQLIPKTIEAILTGSSLTDN